LELSAYELASVYLGADLITLPHQLKSVSESALLHPTPDERNLRLSPRGSVALLHGTHERVDKLTQARFGTI
jgi:hypothetical protein